MRRENTIDDWQTAKNMLYSQSFNLVLCSGTVQKDALVSRIRIDYCVLSGDLPVPRAPPHSVCGPHAIVTGLKETPPALPHLTDLHTFHNPVDGGINCGIVELEDMHDACATCCATATVVLHWVMWHVRAQRPDA
jgi:hypothetical protein